MGYLREWVPGEEWWKGKVLGGGKASERSMGGNG